MDEEWLHKYPFKKFMCKPKYKKRPFLSKEDLQRVISIKLSYKRLQAIRDIFVFMCFNGLAHTDLKELAYQNVHSDSDGNTWLVGNRVTIKAPYVVKPRPIAVEPIKKYRGMNEFKISPDRMFPENKVYSNGKKSNQNMAKIIPISERKPSGYSYGSVSHIAHTEHTGSAIFFPIFIGILHHAAPI